jgi:TolA-binding protein
MIDIKVGSAPSFSEYTNLEMLGLMVQSGQAPFEAYINMLPDGYISNKKELLEITQNNNMKVIQQLQQQLQQSQQVMEQMTKAYQKTQKDMGNIDTIVQENIRLKSMIADISARALKNVQQADEATKEVTNDMTGMLNTLTRKK